MEGLVYDLILARLHGVRKTRRGWEAQCPAHEDSSPSLSLALGERGQLLMWCFAGCTVEQISQRLQVTVRDLFPDSPMDLRDAHAEALRMLRAQERRRERDQGATDDAACWAVIRHARALATRLGPSSEDGWELLAQAASLETMMLNA